MSEVVMPEKDEAPDGEDEEERCVCEALERGTREDGVECWHCTNAHEYDAHALDEVTVHSLSHCLWLCCFPGQACCENEAEDEEEEEDAEEHRKESHRVNDVERRKHSQRRITYAAGEMRCAEGRAMIL